ncbi:MAG: CooT family nickel-binding protein [Desulfuromonadales bacterium]|nr:CooT family nickel-binding protein [Desulfuromonadales bacterium]
MCLNQGAFVLITGDEEKSLENVATLIPGATSLRLIDIYGKTSNIEGVIDEIDFLNNRIVLV